VDVSGARVQRGRQIDLEEDPDDDDDYEGISKTSGQDYWTTHHSNGTWEPVGLVNNEYTQQFELKEDYRTLRNKRYKVKLDQFEDPVTNREVREKIDAKVLTVENYFWTMHAHQEAKFKDENGEKIGEYMMFMPNVINRHWTWRVTKASDTSTVLFTIQKRLYDDHCKVLGLFSCRPVLKIYVGHKNDKSTLIYYGVGDKDLDEPDFKFYHSRAAYKKAKHKWVAKVDHKKHKDNAEDKYKVKARPGEDAGLILLAAVCLDKVGDNARAPEHDEEDDD